VRFRAPRGGIYFWLELDDNIDADTALEHAAASGVRFRPGVRFTGADDGKRFIRLWCVQMPAADVEAGIAVLGAALAKAVKRRSDAANG
jgi:2-aminoadipate transaminase